MLICLQGSLVLCNNNVKLYKSIPMKKENTTKTETCLEIPIMEKI